MFKDILEANDFSIIVDTTQIIPPMTVVKYEAKVTRIYDQKNKQEIGLTPENTCLTMAKTEEEAYKKSQDRAREWAEKQR